MVEIIPAIIPKDLDDLKEKIRLVEPYFGVVQIDVMDGVFVSNETWRSPEELGGLKTKLKLEAHLMIEKPQETMERWLESKVKRVILHWEALEKIHGHEMTPYKTAAGPGFPVVDLAQETHRHNKELGVAINPDTPIKVLDMFIEDIDLVLLMSVKPGKAGQPFIDKVISKISALRAKYPSVKIEVDGGINLENAKKVATAGADILVAGSAVFESPDIGKAIEDLKKAIL